MTAQEKANAIYDLLRRIMNIPENSTITKVTVEADRIDVEINLHDPIKTVEVKVGLTL